MLNSIVLDWSAKETKPARPEAIPITSAILKEMDGAGFESDGYVIPSLGSGFK